MNKFIQDTERYLALLEYRVGISIN